MIQRSPSIGTSLRVLGGILTYLATEHQTKGTYSMFEWTLPLGEGMVPHRHNLESEQLYVLEGSLTVRLEEQLHPLEQGQTLFIPAGAVHAYQNTGSAPARLLAVVSPGFLHEQFFAELGQAADAHDKFLAELGWRESTPRARLNLEVISQSATKYQIEILPLE